MSKHVRKRRAFAQRPSPIRITSSPQSPLRSERLFRHSSLCFLASRLPTKHAGFAGAPFREEVANRHSVTAPKAILPYAPRLVYVLASSISFTFAFWQKLIHFAARPFPSEPASCRNSTLPPPFKGSSAGLHWGPLLPPVIQAAFLMPSKSSQMPRNPSLHRLVPARGNGHAAAP